MTKAFIHKAKFKHEFWAETSNHAAFIINVFSGAWKRSHKMMPKVAVLTTFGAFGHVPFWNVLILARAYF
jgi:hypothetical protein